MATAAEPLLMTVEQYRQLPDCQDAIQELHWGELVTVTFPKLPHTKLQVRLADLLRPLTAGKGVIVVELPFRALPEYELRRADVAFVEQNRWVQSKEDLHGSPELVIEVLSPSNTRAAIREKASLCLSTGTLQFWVVDPKEQTITVLQEKGTTVYAGEQQVPLLSFGSGELAVQSVFE